MSTGKGKQQRAQSGPGGHKLFDDFRSGATALLASSVAPPISIGNGTFTLVGQGIAENDSGAVMGVNGILLTPTDEAQHAIGLTTQITYDVGLHGTIVAEARLEFPDDLVTREVFFGFSDVRTDLAILEGAILHGVTETFTLTASDICGFHMSSELTAATEWHGVHNGGTATGPTASGDINLGTAAGALIVADTFQILRLEMDTSGTARWFIDGKLKQTITGAVSTTTDLCCSLITEEKVGGNAQLRVDYLLVKANRDWTV